MSYFDDEKNVQDYIKMAEGYDGADLIEVLKTFLPSGSSVLELGMGPGVDLDILKNDFTVTGSDSSQVFINLYKEKYPDVDVLKLDAVTIETDRSYDCIYSNKVLHHLQRNELEQSIRRQKELLPLGGLLFHSFWVGQGQENMHDLIFTYYDEDDLTEVFERDFKILKMARYTEMEKNDSIYIVAQKNESNSPQNGKNVA